MKVRESFPLYFIFASHNLRLLVHLITMINHFLYFITILSRVPFTDRLGSECCCLLITIVFPLIIISVNIFIFPFAVSTPACRSRITSYPRIAREQPLTVDKGLTMRWAIGGVQRVQHASIAFGPAWKFHFCCVVMIVARISSMKMKWACLVSSSSSSSSRTSLCSL